MALGREVPDSSAALRQPGDEGGMFPFVPGIWSAEGGESSFWCWRKDSLAFVIDACFGLHIRLVVLRMVYKELSQVASLRGLGHQELFTTEVPPLFRF